MSSPPSAAAPDATLLQELDPPPVGRERPDGRSNLVLACDHGGNAVPRALQGLGLPQTELERHIAIDIGALGLSRGLSDALDAPLVHQRYSRLVIDCNRDPKVASSRPETADGTPVPGNRELSAQDVARRVDEIFRPYQDAVAAVLDARQANGAEPVLIAVHSFTPRLREAGDDRPWHIGVLFNRDPRVGRALIEALRAEGDLVVGENQPYAVDDINDYTIPVHGERRGIPHVEIEVRQDLLADLAGQDAWARRLARLLPDAVKAAGLG